MAQNTSLPRTDELLLWGDLETTGLLKEPGEQTLEIALIVTDSNLNIVDEFGPLVFSATQEALDVVNRNEFVRRMHTGTGLLDKVKASTLSLAEGEEQMLGFVHQHFGDDASRVLFCGNSIRLDRAFIEQDFPTLDSILHYRQIDVSSVGELVRMWLPEVYWSMPEKKSDHTAMTDIRESIIELRYYRENAFTNTSGLSG